jgi:hypothetical protein
MQTVDVEKMKPLSKIYFMKQSNLFCFITLSVATLTLGLQPRQGLA